MIRSWDNRINETKHLLTIDWSLNSDVMCMQSFLVQIKLHLSSFDEATSLHDNHYLNCMNKWPFKWLEFGQRYEGFNIYDVVHCSVVDYCKYVFILQWLASSPDSSVLKSLTVKLVDTRSKPPRGRGNQFPQDYKCTLVTSVK